MSYSLIVIRYFMAALVFVDASCPVRASSDLKPLWRPSRPTLVNFPKATGQRWDEQYNDCLQHHREYVRSGPKCFLQQRDGIGRRERYDFGGWINKFGIECKGRVIIDLDYEGEQVQVGSQAGLRCKRQLFCKL